MPATKPQDRQKKKQGKTVTSASEWKKKGKGEPIELPSGNTALLRAAGVEAFMGQGVIPNDLLPWVQAAITKEETGKTVDPNQLAEEATKAMLEDPSRLKSLMNMANAVLVHCVVEPKITAVPMQEDGEPVPLEDRDGDYLYADEVDLDDKMFVLQYAMGGTEDLVSFRAEQTKLVESVSASKDVE